MEIFKQNNGLMGVLSDAISEGIIVVNHKQAIMATNKATDELFGYPNDTLIGKPLNILIPKKYHSDHGGHFKKFMCQSQKRQMGAGRELYGIRKDGTEFPVEVGLNPFEIYGTTYVMALIIDITERKNYMVELEETVERRTQELRISLKKEKQLNELKTIFLSMVSHEFKNPLTAISTSTALLFKYSKTEQQANREKHLNTIKGRVKYLDRILNDFLSMERLDSGKVNYRFEHFPLSKLVNEVVNDANMFLKKGQNISVPKNIDHISITQDEKIMELVLSNLVNNAVKYSPENTTIHLQFDLEGKILTVQVRDEGIGIPEKEKELIFNRYFRARNALTDQGTGIGLNIVRTHVENIGGHISFTSIENKGTTFKVELPIKKNLPKDENYIIDRG